MGHNTEMSDERENEPIPQFKNEPMENAPLASRDAEFDSAENGFDNHDGNASSDEFNSPKKHFRGRGSSLEPENRFERVSLQFDPEQLEVEDQLAEMDCNTPTEYFSDDSGSVISENASPDVDFRYSLNPYRGCAHGCSYCYARPTHEYLGFNADIDFESKIIVKPNAADLFRSWMRRPKWRGNVEPIMLSGVTDCYQPCEKKFELTRRCLLVANEF